MVIKWSKFAEENLKDFKENSRMEPTNIYNYIKSLVNYVGQLMEQKIPKLSLQPLKNE